MLAVALGHAQGELHVTEAGTVPAFELLVALLHEGLDFYRYAQRRVAPLALRRRFERSAEWRRNLLHELHRVGAADDPARAAPWPVTDAESSYRALCEDFDAARLEACAGQLAARSAASRVLLETCLEQHPTPRVRALLQPYLRLIGRELAGLQQLDAQERVAA
jgi:hypothetical protein